METSLSNPILQFFKCLDILHVLLTTGYTLVVKSSIQGLSSARRLLMMVRAWAVQPFSTLHLIRQVQNIYLKTIGGGQAYPVIQPTHLDLGSCFIETSNYLRLNLSPSITIDSDDYGHFD